MPGQQFQLDADAGARQWLDSHRSARGRVIAYNVQRCCGGGTICQVRVRELSRRDDPDEFTRFLIDPRAAARLPSHFPLTVRGVGPFKHLDLDLEGEQWGTLLYD